MSPPYRCHAFGLRFASSFALPEMRGAADGGEADVTIVAGEAARPAEMAEFLPGVAASPDGFWMAVPDCCRLLVSGGRRIEVCCAPGREADMRAYLLGSAMGALLQQRGLLALHGSAVDLGGGAAVFLGPQGAGKSTMAAMLGHGGHAVLCDDISAIDDAAMVAPGLLSQKLSPASLGALGRSAEGLAPVLTGADKFVLPIADAAPLPPMPLRAVILLEAGDALSLAVMSGSTATATLVANSFRGQLVSPMQRQAAHFAQCVALARRVPVLRLVRPWDLARIDEVADLLRDRLG